MEGGIGFPGRAVADVCPQRHIGSAERGKAGIVGAGGVVDAAKGVGEWCWRKICSSGISSLRQGADASLLYLPPYSPILNPIELAFTKIKRKLRSLRCRVHCTQLWDTIKRVLNWITTHDAAGFSNQLRLRVRNKKNRFE